MPQHTEQRPPRPSVGSLYNGFFVRSETDHRIYLVYDNQRHLTPMPDMIGILGFTPEFFLVIPKAISRRLPYRDFDNIPIGTDIPPQGITVQINPSYIIQPI